MDTASPQPGQLVLPLNSAETLTDDSAHLLLEALPLAASPLGLSETLAYDLWLAAEAEACDLRVEEFCEVLTAVGERFNFGLSPDIAPGANERAVFLRGLRLTDLALATACALGRELAWQRFTDLYQVPITQAAIAITGSATLGHDLAGSLSAELYGLRTAVDSGEQTQIKRRSPLSSYSGRGSFLGWLRTTLAQRHVDHHRRTHRETSLDALDPPEPERTALPIPAELAHLAKAVARTLETLFAEDRFLLSAYFLDHQTLVQIARTLHVHEATVSRRIKRLTSDLRIRLLQELQSGGLSKRAAEEALGTDPRDLEINLRALLQTSQSSPFSNRVDQPDKSSSTAKTPAAVPDQT